MRMRSVIGSALAMVMAAGINNAFAQDARATEILAKTRAAVGGAKLEALKAFSLQASTQRNVGQVQMAADLEIALELPDKYLKSETSRGGMAGLTLSSGFNADRAILPAGASFSGGGTVMFRMGPGGPVNDASKMTDEQRTQLNTITLRNARGELSRLMLGWFAMAHPSLQAQFTYAGEAESPDGKAHVIDVKGAEGFEARLFIDQNNHLPLMLTYKGRQPRMVTQSRTGPASEDERKKLQADAQQQIKREMAEPQPLVEFSMFFENWREVDGITFPHVMRRAVAGETTEEWTINKVKVNPKLDSKKFDTGAK